MDDLVSIKRIATLHPKLRSEMATIISEISSYNIHIRITRAFATFSEQDALYKIYQNGGPKAAPAGLSFHNYGLAIDFCLLHNDGTISFSMTEDIDNNKKADWLQVVYTFQKYGWKWGHVFNDNDHMEKSFGLTEQQCLDKYNKKDFISGTQYINI